MHPYRSTREPAALAAGLVSALLVLPLAPVAASAGHEGGEAAEVAIDVWGDAAATVGEYVGDAGDLLDELLRELAALRANPIDLNSAGLRELLRIPLLSPSDAAAILGLRAELGAFGSVDDVARSGRVRRDVVEAVRPYVIVSPPRGTLVPRAQPNRAGAWWGARLSGAWSVDPDDRWSMPGLGVGSATSPRARLRVGWGDAWRLGASFERDAGEPRLLDHAAFYVSGASPGAAPEDPGVPRFAIVAGDMVAGWAQGLLLSRALFSGSASLPRWRDRVSGYDGACESLARRGLHVGAARGRASAEILCARTHLDASLDELGDAITIRTSGHHRTDGELEGAAALTEVALAGRAVVTVSRSLDLGASLVRFGYDPPLARGDPERQRFRPFGEEFISGSIDARLAATQWRLGVELARTEGGGTAFVLAGRANRGSAASRFGIGHLSRDFWSPLGSGIPGVSGGANGTSCWVGARYGSASSWRLETRASVTGHPWRTYGSELPPATRRASVAVEAPLMRVGRATAEVRTKDRTVSAGGTRHESSTTVRITIRTAGHAPVTLSAVRKSGSSGALEEGVVIALGVRAEIPVGADAVLAGGLTSVTERGEGGSIAQYEPPLPGEFGVRALNAAGTRWYIRASCGLTGRAALAVRLAGGPEPGKLQFGLSIDAKGG